MLEQVPLACPRHRLQLGMASESMQKALNVVTGRRLADPEPRSDRVCPHAFAEEREHFSLAGAQVDLIAVGARHAADSRRTHLLPRDQT